MGLRAIAKFSDCWPHFSLEPPRAESLPLAYCSSPESCQRLTLYV